MKLGLFGLLGIVFIVLKLCGIIAWSWWWVLSPFWLAPILFILIAGATFGFLWIAHLFE